MQSPMSLLMKYLDEIGAAPIVPTLDKEAAQSLPVFISQTYEVHRASMFDREYSLLLFRGEDRPTPAEAEKHLNLGPSSVQMWRSFS